MSINDFQQLLVALEDYRVVASCNLAGYAILLYDHVLTLGLEIELIWPGPWSLGKVLFFATKYSALVDGTLAILYHTAPSTMSPTTCALFYRLSGGLIILGILIAELILVFRTWAIWERDNKLAIGLLGLLALLILPIAILAYIGLGHAEFGPSPSRGVEGCWITRDPTEILFIAYVLLVVFESVIVALTLYKGREHFRYSSSSLAVTLYRDGLQYYLYLIGFSLLNIIVLVIAPKPGPSLILMQRVLHSILTARVLLNLREAASQDLAKNAPMDSFTSTVLVSADPSQLRTRIPRSGAIIGVGTWVLARDQCAEYDKWGVRK